MQAADDILDAIISVQPPEQRFFWNPQPEELAADQRSFDTLSEAEATLFDHIMRLQEVFEVTTPFGDRTRH